MLISYERTVDGVTESMVEIAPAAGHIALAMEFQKILLGRKSRCLQKRATRKGPSTAAIVVCPLARRTPAVPSVYTRRASTRFGHGEAGTK